MAGLVFPWLVCEFPLMALFTGDDYFTTSGSLAFDVTLVAGFLTGVTDLLAGLDFFLLS